MALAYLEVIRIVCWCNFHHTSAVSWIDIIISDDGNFALDNRQQRFAADKVFVALVVWIDRYGYVAKHRLGTRRSDNDFADFID